MDAFPRKTAAFGICGWSFFLQGVLWRQAEKERNCGTQKRQQMVIPAGTSNLDLPTILYSDSYRD